MKRAARLLWRALILLSPLIPLLLYFKGAWYGLTEPYSLSMILGISGYIYFMNALILSSRLKLLDRIAGHDRVLGFHRHLALLSLILALLHGIVKSMVFSPWVFPGPLGIAALVPAFLIALISTLFFKNRPPGQGKGRAPDYSRVKSIHNLLVLSAAVVAVHVLFAATTAEQWSRTILMSLWGILAMGIWFRHKMIRPMILKKRGQKVVSLLSQGSDVLEIRISKESFPPYRAGQFVYLRFPGLAGGEEHPFTLSSAPGEDELAVTVKKLGNYTSRLESLRVGDPVLVDGPYGNFTPDIHENSPLVMIAGGIGITPFHSFVKEMDNRADIRDDRSCSVLLLWSVHNQQDLIYDSLFSLMEEYQCFRYRTVVTASEKRIDAALLSSLAGEDRIEDIQWYCCGPSAMTAEIRRQLGTMGIRRGKIRVENFAY